MNTPAPDRPTPPEKAVFPHVPLIPRAELERKAELARINAERERLSHGKALKDLQAELDRQSLTGRPLSPDMAARPLTHEPKDRGRER